MGSCKVWDKHEETSACWENPALISFSCGLMGKTENDLDPYVVFHTDIVIYPQDENNLLFYCFIWTGFYRYFLKFILIWSFFS